MSATHDPPPLGHLLAHRAWVRTLARHLSRDAADADDLEQDAWLAAIRRPPREGEGLRAWLGAVLRNRSRERHRGDVHRSEREARSARPEAVGGGAGPGGASGGAALVAEAEAHGRVVQAVLTLDEPYRETVLLRFFEGLPPRGVAERMGVPVETVRTRLRRAGDTLRERLGGRREDWLGALAPLIGVGDGGIGGPSLHPAAGGIAMQASTKVGIAAAVLLLVAGMTTWIAVVGDGPADDTRTATAPAAAPATGARRGSTAAPHRQRAAAETAAEPAAPDVPAPRTPETGLRPRGRVTGRVLLADGSPAAGAAVAMPFADRAAATGWVATDADGRYVLDVPVADAERPVWVLAPGHRGGSPGIFKITVDAPLAASELRLEADGEAVIRGVLRSATGASIDAGSVKVSAPYSQDDLVKAAAQRDAAPILMLATIPKRDGEPESVAKLRALRGDVGAGGRFELRVPASFGAMYLAASAPGHAPAWIGPVHPSDYADRELVFTLQPLPRVHGQVVDAKTLAPLPGVSIAFTSVSPPTPETTGLDGRFDVHAKEGQQVPLQVNLAGYFGEHVHPGKDGAAVTVKLWRVARIEGRVRLASGRPVAGAYVQATVPPNQRVGSGAGGATSSAKDGSFVLGSVRDAVFELSAACVDGCDVSFRKASVADIAAGRTDVDIVVDEAPSISCRVVDEDGRPVKGILVMARVGGVWGGGATSDAGGLVRLIGVGAELSTLVVIDQGGAAGGYLNREIEGVAAGTVGLDIVVKKGLTISGRIVDEDGRPVARRRVVVADAASNPFDVHGDGVLTDADGRFVAGGLAAGAYRLQMNGSESNWTRMWLVGGESVAAGTAGVKLSLSSGGTISGFVLDAAGAPVKGETVQALLGPKSPVARTVTTDDRGRFELKNLAPGRTYTVLSRHGRLEGVALGTRDLRLAQ